MLTYRKALLIAVAIITVFLLLRSTHGPAHPTPPRVAVEQPSSVSEPPPSEHDQADITRVTAKPSVPKPAVVVDQKPLNELSNKPLRSQLSYLFPYEPTSKFPAYIWQTWRTSPSEPGFPDGWRPFESSWTDLHPGFIHEVVTDASAVHVLRHLYSAIPDVMEAYESLPQPVLKADFFRYLILLARGGIYTDIDTFALQSAVRWVPENVPRDSYGLVIGIEADPARDDWAKWYSRRIQFCQWTIQAKPGHPVLKEIVARITEETLQRKRAGELTKYDVKKVVDLTGPAIWTDTVFGYFNDPEHFDTTNGADLPGGNVTWRQFTGITTQKKLGDVVVLPITCFSPGVKQMGAGNDDDPMAMVKHFFEGTSARPRESTSCVGPHADPQSSGSWKPEWERHIGQLKEANS